MTLPRPSHPVVERPNICDQEGHPFVTHKDDDDEDVFKLPSCSVALAKRASRCPSKLNSVYIPLYIYKMVCIYLAWLLLQESYIILTFPSPSVFAG